MCDCFDLGAWFCICDAADRRLRRGDWCDRGGVSNEPPSESVTITEGDAPEGAFDVEAPNEDAPAVSEATPEGDADDDGSAGDADEATPMANAAGAVDEGDAEGEQEIEPVSPDGWRTENGLTYYYEDGKRLSGEQYLQDDAGEWHWYYFWPENGCAMDTGWSFIPSNGGKWAYYDEQGRMAHGQQLIDGAWYLFDERTGATTYGFAYIPDQNKWVFYDRVTGKMQYGQQCIDAGWYLLDQYTGAVTYGFAYLPDDKKWVFYDRVTGRMLYGQQYIDGGWYYLTPVTGAVDYEWAYLPDDNKWVYYDAVTGRMIYGSHMIDGRPRYFDKHTGRVYGKSEEVNLLMSVVKTTYGKDIDCPGAVAAAGGILCPYGPCMSYVWWCFDKAGLRMFLCDGAVTGYPHHNYDWYNSRGRVNYSPQVGDIAFFRYAGWADAIGASASHAGIVVGVSGNGVVLVADALTGGIYPRTYSVGGTIGFAHPYWG